MGQTQATTTFPRRRPGRAAILARGTTARHRTHRWSAEPARRTGVANDTLLFDVERGCGAVEGYVARLAAPNPLYLDYDLELHYRMYAAMSDVATVPTPGVLGYEPDPSVVGARFS